MDAMQWAQGLSQRPYEAYTAPRISPFSSDQTNAFQQVRDMPNVGQSQYTASGNALDQAQGLASNAGYTATQYQSPYQAASYNPSQITTGQWNNAAAQQYMDPYINQVMNTVLQQQNEQFARQQNARNGQRAMSGSFGGLRQGVEDAVAQGQFNNNTAAQTAQLLSNAYGNAQQTFGTDQARALQAQQLQEGANQFGANFNDSSNRAYADYLRQFGQMNEGNLQNQAQIGQQQAAGLGAIGQQQAALGSTLRGNAGQDIDALRSIGLDQQRQTQAGLDMAYNDFVNQRDYEMQMLNQYNSIIRGMPISSNSNVVTSDTTNPYSQMLGLGLGAAGLYNALQPPSTTTPGG